MDKELALYKAIIEASALVDSKPKNIFFPVEKGKEYESMCIQLAQGYEIDWISFPYIICNEFGKGEHIDSFNRRHPNFAEDIRNAQHKHNKIVKKYYEAKERQ